MQTPIKVDRNKNVTLNNVRKVVMNKKNKSVQAALTIY